MSTSLRILSFALIATVSSVFAADMTKDPSVMAETAKQLYEKGQTNEAQTVFQQFTEAWKAIERKTGAFNKPLCAKAADCFLTFGQPTNAYVLLTDLFSKTRHQPPDLVYLYIKSLFETGNSSNTVSILHSHVALYDRLPIGKLQELAVIGAKASAKLGDTKSRTKFLKDAVSYGVDTQMGKDAKQELDRLEQESGKKE